MVVMFERESLPSSQPHSTSPTPSPAIQAPARRAPIVAVLVCPFRLLHHHHPVSPSPLMSPVSPSPQERRFVRPIRSGVRPRLHPSLPPAISTTHPRTRRPDSGTLTIEPTATRPNK